LPVEVVVELGRHKALVVVVVVLVVCELAHLQV
jgi:hypothetical protein